MEFKDYCTEMTKDLTEWKTKLDNVVTHFDSDTCGEKSKVLSQINDLYILREELQGRIDTLRTQCPTIWEDEKKGIDEDLSKLRTKAEEVYFIVNPYISDCGCGCGHIPVYDCCG